MCWHTATTPPLSAASASVFSLADAKCETREPCPMAFSRRWGISVTTIADPLKRDLPSYISPDMFRAAKVTATIAPPSRLLTQSLVRHLGIWQRATRRAMRLRDSLEEGHDTGVGQSAHSCKSTTPHGQEKETEPRITANSRRAATTVNHKLK